MEMALCNLNNKIIRIQVLALNVVQVKAALQTVTYNGISWVEVFAGVLLYLSENGKSSLHLVLLICLDTGEHAQLSLSDS